MKKILIFILFFLLTLANSSFAKWVAVNGPYDGRTSEFASKLAIDGNKICMASYSYVYISNDKGNYWTYASNGIPSDFVISSIAFRKSCIFVGTTNSRIFISNNYGSSYKVVKHNLPDNSNILASTICNDTFLISLNAYNADFSGVYYSTNFGEYWEKSKDISAFVFDIYNTGKGIYAATESGVYKSTNNGINWKKLGLDDHCITSIYVVGNKIYAADAYNNNGDIFLSEDDGNNWRKLASNTYIVSDNKSILIDDKGNIYFISLNGLNKSVDNCQNWQLVYYRIGVKSIAFDGSCLYVDNRSGGVAISQDYGDTWDNGFQYYRKEVHAIYGYNSNIYAGTNSGLFSSFSNGDTLENVFEWPDSEISVGDIASDSSRIFVSGYNRVGEYSIIDSIWEWSYLEANNNTVYSKVSCFAINDSLRFAGTYGDGVFYKRKNSSHWVSFNIGIEDLFINDIVINDSFILACTNNKGIFISKINENNWQSSSTGLLDSCIQTIAIKGNTIFIGTKSNGIFKSVDNGKNWDESNVGLFTKNVKCLYAFNNLLFAGTSDCGVFISINNGDSWNSCNEGLMNLNINSIASNDSFLFIASNGGILKRSLIEFPPFNENSIFSINKIIASDEYIYLGDSTDITIDLIAGSPPFFYLWSNGSTNQSIRVSPTQKTIYNVTVTDSEQNIVEGSITINVLKPLNIFESKLDCVNANYYPNPVSDDLFIKINLSSISSYIWISNELGQILRRERVFDGTNQINFSNVPIGYYYIIFENDTNINSFRVLKK